MQASTQKALDESAVAMKELELALAKANAPAPNENIGNYVLATREPPTRRWPARQAAAAA